MRYLILFMLFVCYACDDDFVNPYDGIEAPITDSTLVAELEPTSLAGIHASIFRPTCANSGCHDGTFEPDFRTINGTYNTLVNQAVIKNDPQNSFEFRVVPGDPESSQLMARLTYDIDGNSGVMPLLTDPGSDYPENREDYIDRIREWIARGAPRE